MNKSFGSISWFPVKSSIEGIIKDVGLPAAHQEKCVIFNYKFFQII